MDKEVASVLLVPYSNQAKAFVPFGLTVPFNVAELEVSAVALTVVAVGPETEGPPAWLLPP